jgi:hypothetical protein
MKLESTLTRDCEKEVLKIKDNNLANIRKA